jgi:hypothetical protein
MEPPKPPLGLPGRDGTPLAAWRGGAACSGSPRLRRSSVPDPPPTARPAASERSRGLPMHPC